MRLKQNTAVLLVFILLIGAVPVSVYATDATSHSWIRQGTIWRL